MRLPDPRGGRTGVRFEEETMSKESERWRKEVRAELELMWGRQSESSSRLRELGQKVDGCALRLDQQATKIEEQGQAIAEQGKQIARQGQQIADQGKMIALQSTVIADSLRHVAALAEQVADSSDAQVGRLRQLDSKIVKYLDSLEKGSNRRFDDLEARVAKLEQRNDPAA